MHANGNLTISDGTVDITKSYEGIEGSIVTIDGRPYQWYQAMTE